MLTLLCSTPHPNLPNPSKMPGSTTSSIKSIIKPKPTTMGCGEECDCCGCDESCWCVVM